MEEQQDKIHQLITEKIAGLINAVDEEYLDNLIDTDPAIRKQWFQMMQIYHELSNVKSSSWTTPPWRRVNSIKQKHIHYRWTRWAAIGLILFMASTLSYFLRDNNTSENPFLVPITFTSDHVSLQLADGQTINPSDITSPFETAGMILENKHNILSISESNRSQKKIKLSEFNTLIVPVGMDYKIQLPDGTKVWLNSATKLKFPLRFSGVRREVEVQGEAYFDVMEETDRPFIVRLPETEIRVLGTSFNVNSYDSDTEKVALIQGKLEVKTSGDVSEISPGTMLTYRKGIGVSKSNFDQKRILGWQEGIFYFYNSSLPEICQVLPRWYGVSVVIDNPSIEVKRFAGILDKSQPIEVFLEDLKTITELEYYFENDGRELHFRVPIR